MKKQTSPASLRVSCISSDGLVDPGNPLLENVPLVPKLPEAMRALDQRNVDNFPPASREEAVIRKTASAYVSSVDTARALMTVVAQVRSSCLDRDLRMPEYRDYTVAANIFLHERRTRYPTPPSRFGIGPRARPHGIVVAAPVRTGRRCFADTVESVIGRGVQMVRVKAGEGFSEYMQLRCLRIQWPIEGKVSGLAQAFLGAFDAALNTEYANRIRSPLFRESNVVAAIAALGVTSNLGLLIVEKIGTESATTKAAHATWDALAQFTRATGIPVLCLATPGAVVCGLSRLPSSTGALAPHGLIEITRAKKADERCWEQICETQFNATLSVAGVSTMPPWLPSAAHDLTLGYPGLLATVLSNLALHLLSLNEQTVNAEIFHSYGKKALALHEGDLNAVRQIEKGGLYQPSSLVRHGDWLSVRQLSSTHPVPRLLV